MPFPTSAYFAGVSINVDAIPRGLIPRSSLIEYFLALKSINKLNVIQNYFVNVIVPLSGINSGLPG